MLDILSEPFHVNLCRGLISCLAAVIALTNAVEKAGSTEAKKVAEVLHKQIAVTPFGEVSFDEHGDALGVGYTLYTVKDGKFEQVK